MVKQLLKNDITNLTTKINIGGKCAQGLHNEVSLKRTALTRTDFKDYALDFATIQKKWMQRINLVWICIYCGKKRFTQWATDEEKQLVANLSLPQLQFRLDEQDAIAELYGKALKENR